METGSDLRELFLTWKALAAEYNLTGAKVEKAILLAGVAVIQARMLPWLFIPAVTVLTVRAARKGAGHNDS